MEPPPSSRLVGEVVLPAGEMGATLAFFRDLGFRLEAIGPAEDPRWAVLSGYGMRVRLVRDRPPSEETPAPRVPLPRLADEAAGVLRLVGAELGALGGERVVTGPNGTRIEIVKQGRPQVPPLRASFVLARMRGGQEWKRGRAGMWYRDLLPGRLGGHLIASHIAVREGGEVADEVHYHDVRFQMIYCARGWAQLVYEDQGPPFVLHPGDCVLQPPRIRHRVLACSDGLEVFEVGCPAAHETRIDHDLVLPTPEPRSERRFDGQRFVRHERANTRWGPWRLGGYEARDLGIAEGTGGLVDACVARRVGTSAPSPYADARTRLVIVLGGAATLAGERLGTHEISAGDAFVVPAGWSHALVAEREGFELLEVTLDAEAGAGASGEAGPQGAAAGATV